MNNPGAAPASAAPDKVYGTPFTITLGEREIKMTRVKQRDLAELAEHIRDQRINAVIRHRAAMRPIEYAQAMAHVSAIDPLDDEVYERISTPSGMAYLIWRSMHRADPKVTLDDAAELHREHPELSAALLGNSDMLDKLNADEEPDGPDPMFGSGDAHPDTPTGEQAPQCFAESTE